MSGESGLVPERRVDDREGDHDRANTEEEHVTDVVACDALPRLGPRFDRRVIVGRHLFASTRRIFRRTVGGVPVSSRLARHVPSPLVPVSRDNAAETRAVPVSWPTAFGAEKEAAPTRLREECLAGAEIRAASGTGGTGVAALHTQR